MLAYLLMRAVLAFPSLAPLAARLLDAAVPRYRRIARENLLLAGYSEPEPIIDGVFCSIARLIGTFAEFPSINRDNVRQRIGYVGLEHFTQAMARGKGVLVATAHLGNWELSAFSHAYMTGPMNIVVRQIGRAHV